MTIFPPVGVIEAECEGALNKPTACVSGASGLVGGEICRHLVRLGYSVRALSRRRRSIGQSIEVVNGDITNERDLKAFMKGAQMCFHCAAETSDVSGMWEVNVRGTENIISSAEEAHIKYLCHMSSVGVIGRVDEAIADESAACRPQNAYEKSKWAAEQIVARGVKGCKVIILRPTNVVHGTRPGVLAFIQRRSLRDVLKAFISGGECAHVVNVEDVAAAATYLISHPASDPQCFIVSCDDEPLNTFGSIWALSNAFRRGEPTGGMQPAPHLPVLVPHLIRRVLRGRSNSGVVRYSSKKLLETGFVFRRGVRDSVKEIAEAQGSRQDVE